MDDIEVRFSDKVPADEIKAPVLIEGLPGIGHVGKLVAEHMIQELGAEKVAEIHSIFFPPQVIIDEHGTVRLANNEIYYYTGETHRFLFLVGDYQATSSEGHYLLADAYLDIAAECGVSRVYTLGGYGVGHLVDEPRVLGAVNQPDLRGMIEAAGGIVQRDEPGGGIIGAAGLLLGLGISRGIEGVCLMGETSGYLVDPRSAASLLKVLTTLLEIEIDPTRLEQRACEMEHVLQKLIDGERGSPDDELRYIV
jgi:uncharacterized protein (TIGR00162 family)